MSGISLRKRAGGDTTLSTEEISALGNRLRGRLAMPGDDGYDAACHIWNGMIDHRPALVAQCSGTADVVDSVRFAREHDLLISVRSGGHNIAGTSLAPGGFTLDLSGLRAVHVEPRTRRVRAQPGCCWADVDRETQMFGLVVPGGIVSTTGIAGFTLGGGFGWASRRYGLACDWLRSVDVVTGDGELVRAASDENPDLFWALRGGSGNFGVVTSFEYEAAPFGPEITGGMLLHPHSRGHEVLALFRDLVAGASENFCPMLVARRAPALPFVPEAFHGEPVIGIAVCDSGDGTEGEDAARRLRGLGEPVVDGIGRKPFGALQQMLDMAQPFGRRYYWKSEYLAQYPAELDDDLLGHVARIPSAHPSMLCMALGGAIRRPPEDTAAGNRDAGCIFNIQAAWEDAAQDDTHLSWARGFHDDVRPWSTGGTYVNFLNEEDLDTRMQAAWGSDLHRRLAGAKARFDPDNFFRLGHNIAPAAGGSSAG